MFNPWIEKISWIRKWQPTPVSLPGKSRGRRSLVGYSPRGRRESDTTERLQSLITIRIMRLAEVYFCITRPTFSGESGREGMPTLRRQRNFHLLCDCSLRHPTPPKKDALVQNTLKDFQEAETLRNETGQTRRAR